MNALIDNLSLAPYITNAVYLTVRTRSVDDKDELMVVAEFRLIQFRKEI